MRCCEYKLDIGFRLEIAGAAVEHIAHNNKTLSTTTFSVCERTQYPLLESQGKDALHKTT